ncbi:superoxide dismutase family protein [uncultured Pseudokineococcus sp.]|uniref:superoxide dismutase family protein n=1 Tax=uncultured Pseudokineococcus sp. TaxID=1642928 RepID=UPI00261AFE88|nr:superoxide dismutase family protein [uncultured Pseudokineococcus sp.]
MPSAVLRALTLAGVPLLLAAGCSGEEAADVETEDPGVSVDEEGLDSGYSAMDPGTAGVAVLTAALVDPEGTEIGVVGMDPVPEGTVVKVILTDSGLEAGYHRLHLYETGLCEPGSQSPSDPSMTGGFLSAGGYLDVGPGDQGPPSGELASLYVLSTGDASLSFVTDAFTVDDITDADGTTVMVHSGAGDVAGIPAGPDQETPGTARRVACALIAP